MSFPDFEYQNEEPLAFKANYGEFPDDFFNNGTSFSTFQESLQNPSRNGSPSYLLEPFSEEANFSLKNPFSGRMTLNLIRNMSSDVPLPQSPTDNTNSGIENEMTSVLNQPAFDQLSDGAFGFDKDELCTGKQAPLFEEEQISYNSPQPKEQILRKQIKKPKEVKSVTRQRGQKSKKSSKQDSKNIVKNYGKAMASFALTDASTPYLEQITQKYEVTLKEFRSFMLNKKESIDSIGSLRDLLCPDELYDEPEEMTFKAIFRDISEVFVRDFAVNWIFSSKSIYKSALLNYRFKMLRRVVNPSGFTYLKSQ